MIFHLESMILFVDCSGYVLLSSQHTHVYGNLEDLQCDLSAWLQPRIITLVLKNMSIASTEVYHANMWRDFLWRRHQRYFSAHETLQWIYFHKNNNLCISGVFTEHQGTHFQKLLSYLSTTHHRLKAVIPFCLYVQMWAHNMYPQKNIGIVLSYTSGVYALELTAQGHMITHTLPAQSSIAPWKHDPPDIILNTTSTSYFPQQIPMYFDALKILKARLPHNVTYLGNITLMKKQLRLFQSAQIFEGALFVSLVLVLLILIQHTIPFWKTL